MLKSYRMFSALFLLLLKNNKAFTTFPAKSLPQKADDVSTPESGLAGFTALFWVNLAFLSPTSWKLGDRIYLT